MADHVNKTLISKIQKKDGDYWKLWQKMADHDVNKTLISKIQKKEGDIYA